MCEIVGSATLDEVADLLPRPGPGRGGRRGQDDVARVLRSRGRGVVRASMDDFHQRAGLLINHHDMSSTGK